MSNYNSNQSSLKSFRSNGGSKNEGSNSAKERKLLIEEVSVMRMIVEGVMQQYRAVTDSRNQEINMMQGERGLLREAERELYSIINGIKGVQVQSPVK